MRHSKQVHQSRIMKTEANVKTQFLSAETVAHLVSTLGIAACLRGVADYLHADYLRWEAFDKSARWPATR